jgi:inorganic pyrophosphatase
MSFVILLDEGKFFEIQKRSTRSDSLEKESTTFCGALRPHYNPNMILLLTSPLESSSEVFEFRSEDIVYAEELSSLSKPNGVTIEQVRLWVRNGSPAMRMEP